MTTAEPLAEPATSSACAAGCRRHAARGPLFAFAGWLAAGVAALSVSVVPLEAGEELCGVWGCFPELPPLVAMHLFGAVVVAAAAWTVRTYRPALVRPAGLLLFLAAAAFAAVVIEKDLTFWLARVSESAHHHWPKRVAYKLANLSDVPLVPAMAAGLAGVAFGGGSRRHRG